MNTEQTSKNIFMYTYALFLALLLIAQAQYRSMDQFCKKVPRKRPLQLTKLRKVVAIYKTNELVLSKK